MFPYTRIQIENSETKMARESTTFFSLSALLCRATRVLLFSPQDSSTYQRRSSSSSSKSTTGVCQAGGRSQCCKPIGMVVLLAKALDLHKYSDAPVKLRRIEFAFVKKSVDGSELVPAEKFRTKKEGLRVETEKLFDAASFSELVYLSHKAAEHMCDVGLFGGQVIPVIDVNSQPLEEADQNNNTIAIAPVDSANSDADDIDDYKVIFVVQEARPIRGNLSAGIDNLGETNGSLQIECPSFAGKGERGGLQFSQGWRGTTLFNVTLNKPMLGWQRYTTLGCSMFRSGANMPWSGLSHNNTGFALELWHRQQRHHHVEHTLRWHFDWRQLFAEKNTCFNVREHSGHSLKSSLEHIVQLNTQDNDILPQKGVLLKLANELAGFAGTGDVRFLRNTLQLRATTALPYSCILSCGFQGTYITPRGGRSLNMLDRVYLGGATDLRGFSTGRAGPVTQGNVMGGNASWAAALHVYRPLYPPNIVFGHLFACAGNTHSADYTHSSAPMFTVLNRLYSDPRASVGLGLAFKLGQMARLELNYCIPLRSRATDEARPGFQFGAGISFL